MADKIIFKTLMLKGDAGEPTAEQTQAAVDEYMQQHPDAAIDETIINSAVDEWLDDHPEATTTVQDGSITSEKLNDNVKNTYLPRNISARILSSITSGQIIEKSSDLDEVTFNTNNYTVRDCDASGVVDISNATHGIIENMHITNINAGIHVDKESGWCGSHKISKIFSYGCAYPFKVLCDDVTDFVIKDCTFENFRQGLITNAPMTIKDSYFGDNVLVTDAENPDCAILAKSNALIKLDNCNISIGVRSGQNNPTIVFDSTESQPATVELRNCDLGSGNQNIANGGYGGIAELSNINDRLIIDNCTFDIFKRVNENHNVAPFVLKPFQTVWSKTPFYNYICGGDIPSICALSPVSNTLSLVDTENVNPFGGKIIKYINYGFRCFYEIPDYLVGKEMWLHVYCCGLSNANTPSINYDSSDCVETEKSSNFNQGYHPDITPFLNRIKFTPTKTKGSVVFYVGTNGEVSLAGVFLVEDLYKHMVCRYKTYSNKMYAHQVPVNTGQYGDVVWSIDPANTNCDGWKYTTTWNAFTL